MPAPFSAEAPKFEREVLGAIYAGHGDDIPVSAFPCDGTFPTGTAKWEKRNLALEIPVWDTKTCIQCGKCAMVCPHAVIRIKVYDSKELASAPADFQIDATPATRNGRDMKYTIQVAPEDCTGCGICVDVCPAKNKSETRLKAINMEPQPPLREPESENWKFFLKLPELDRRNIKLTTIRQQQVQEPLFEFSGACSGCGETPYLKLLSQLFGDRAIIANATGCSSIYGGNLPTTPWSKNAEGRGPAWSNSLFEDNAEFGLGFRVSIDKQTRIRPRTARRLSRRDRRRTCHRDPYWQPTNGRGGHFRTASTRGAAERKIANCDSAEAKQLLALADMLVKKSVWIVGGDGWAYDIGYGGLDHVLGQWTQRQPAWCSIPRFTPILEDKRPSPRHAAAVAKFAAGGKPGRKKDLGLDGHELRQRLCGQRRHGRER